MATHPAQPSCESPSAGRSILVEGGVAVRRGAAAWEVSPDLADVLLDERGLRFDEWHRQRRIEVVKSGPHRTVYRLALPEGEFYVKHYKAADWKARARNLVRPCLAVLEARAAAQVARAGVETIAPVAVGTSASSVFPRDSFLVTRAIRNVESLHDFVLRPLERARIERQPRLRQNLARRLGELAARLHRAGLLHGDFHPGNVLIRLEAQAELRLWLIDLHAVVRRRRFGLRAVERNLALLNTFFSRYSTAADRLRFFRAYWNEFLRNVAGCGLSHAARRVEAHCRNAVQRAYRKGDRKWLRPNRRIVIANRGEHRGRGLSRLGTQSLEEFRDNPERLFAAGKVRFWRRRTPAERFAAVDLATSTGAWQCYVRSTAQPRTGLGGAIPGRWSPLRRAWEMGHALIRRGMCTPLPLLYTETRSLALVREYLVTERIPNVLPLPVFLEHSLTTAGENERETWLRAYAVRLASQMRRLHDCGLDHRNLTAGRLLVPTNFAVRDAWILGVDQVHLHRRLSERQVRDSFVRLNESLAPSTAVRTTHRLRFLRRYLGSRFAAEWKPLWRSIQERSQFRSGEVNPGAVDRRAFLAASAALCAAALSGCRLADKPVSLPARHSLRSDQLLVLSDFKLPKDHPLIQDLTRLRQDVSATLELPLDHAPVVVYLFTNELEYQQYLSVTYPKLPPRRAYFVGTPSELAVYTFWGENIQEDLRHEYTHGLLHSGLRRVPLWIDEGLAEYFEVVGNDPARINAEYAHRLSTALANGWRPDMPRLERIEEFSNMQHVDYQESWAWVHFLLHSTPETREVLVGYVRDLKTQMQPVPLSSRLKQQIPAAEERFLSYIASLPQARHLAEAR